MGKTSNKFNCPKCGNRQADIDIIRTTGKGFTRFFNIQNRQFTAISCIKCGYTELYKGEKSGISNVLDFLTN